MKQPPCEPPGRASHGVRALNSQRKLREAGSARLSQLHDGIVVDSDWLTERLTVSPAPPSRLAIWMPTVVSVPVE